MNKAYFLNRFVASLVENILLGHLLITVSNNVPGERITFPEMLAKTGLDIPRWKFFGPFPGVHDYALFAREIDCNGKQEFWKRVDKDVQRPWHAIFWNPGNRRPKVIFDAAQQIKMLAAEHYGESAIIENSLPFKLLRAITEREIRTLLVIKQDTK